MTVTVLTEHAEPDDVHFGLSPLAELGAALHTLTAVDHGRSHLAERTWTTMPAGWQAECRLFAPCWGGYRARLLFPGDRVLDADVDGELDALARMPVDRVVEATVYALTGGIQAPEGRDTQDWLLRCATGRAAGPAAALLLDDPSGFLRRLVTFLAQCWSSFFAEEWSRIAPALRLAAVRGEHAVRHRGVTAGLAGLTPVARIESRPARVLLDKLHHGVIDLARTPLLVVPTAFGAPHLLVKHEPGWPAVMQYPHEVRPAARPPIESSMLRSRLRLLADPVHVRLCRSLARHPRSTRELAEAYRMSPPEMSRHLRALREVGLVETHRCGRFVLYQLRYGEFDRLGSDLLDVLLR